VTKVRPALSEKILWDAQVNTFRHYKNAITGHLLQVGAGYLVHHDFQTSYLKYLANGTDYLDSEDYAISYPDISMAQAKLDRTYLYGMLVSSNRRDGGERKLLLKHQRTHDGILA